MITALRPHGHLHPPPTSHKHRGNLFRRTCAFALCSRTFLFRLNSDLCWGGTLSYISKNPFSVGRHFLVSPKPDTLLPPSLSSPSSPVPLRVPFHSVSDDTWTRLRTNIDMPSSQSSQSCPGRSGPPPRGVKVPPPKVSAGLPGRRRRLPQVGLEGRGHYQPPPPHSWLSNKCALNNNSCRTHFSLSWMDML